MIECSGAESICSCLYIPIYLLQPIMVWCWIYLLLSVYTYLFPPTYNYLVLNLSAPVCIYLSICSNLYWSGVESICSCLYIPIYLLQPIMVWCWIYLLLFVYTYLFAPTYNGLVLNLSAPVCIYLHIYSHL